MKIESQKHIDALDKNLLKTCQFASQCIDVEIKKRDKKKYIRIFENAAFFRQKLTVLGVSPNADKSRIYPYDWDTNKYKEEYITSPWGLRMDLSPDLKILYQASSESLDKIRKKKK